jgi:hypothetical protein
MVHPEKKARTLKHYKIFLTFMGVLYSLLALTFYFFPSKVFYLINVGPQVFNIAESVPDSTEKFWLVLATSMLGMLSALSFLAAESPFIRGYSLTHLLSKVISVAGFFYFFLNDQRYFAYLLGIITDVPIAGILIWYIVRTTRIAKQGT